MHTKAWNTLPISCCVLQAISDHRLMLCRLSVFAENVNGEEQWFSQRQSGPQNYRKESSCAYGALLKRHRVSWAWLWGGLWPEGIWKRFPTCPCHVPLTEERLFFFFGEVLVLEKFWWEPRVYMLPPSHDNPAKAYKGKSIMQSLCLLLLLWNSTAHF